MNSKLLIALCAVSLMLVPACRHRRNQGQTQTKTTTTKKQQTNGSRKTKKTTKKKHAPGKEEYSETLVMVN
jgi:hypothetical protein